MHLSTIPRLSATGGSLRLSVSVSVSVICVCAGAQSAVCRPAASSWGKPQGKAFRDGFLHEALDEMSTPAPKKSVTMPSSGK